MGGETEREGEGRQRGKWGEGRVRMDKIKHPIILPHLSPPHERRDQRKKRQQEQDKAEEGAEVITSTCTHTVDPAQQ